MDDSAIGREKSTKKNGHVNNGMALAKINCCRTGTYRNTEDRRK
jgi:hypothetical protein